MKTLRRDWFVITIATVIFYFLFLSESQSCSTNSDIVIPFVESVKRPYEADTEEMQCS